VQRVRLAGCFVVNGCASCMEGLLDDLDITLRDKNFVELLFEARWASK